MSGNGKLHEQELMNALAETEQGRMKLFELLAVVLEKKHGGRCDIKAEDVPKPGSYFNCRLDVQSVPIVNLLRISLLRPNEEAVPVEVPKPELVKPVVEEAVVEEIPEVESQACANEWHSDPERVGRFCSFCGSGAVVENLNDGASA